MSNSLIQYWDSDVLIHAIQRTPEHIVELEPLINEAENGNLQIVVSTFSLMELYKDLDGENVTSKEDDELIISFFDNPYFIKRDLTEPIALNARQISRETGIKPKDAVHVATALYFNIPVLFSFDKELAKKFAKLNNSSLEITCPKWEGQLELFGGSAEESENVETEKLATALHTFLQQPNGNGNGNEDEQVIKQPEISLSEQTNEKENIKIEQTISTAIEKATAGTDQE